MSGEEDINEIVRKKLEKLRRDVIEHDRSSRANQGRNTWPLRWGLIVTVPLFSAVFGLYGYSIFYTRSLARSPNQQQLEAVDVEVIKDEH